MKKIAFQVRPLYDQVADVLLARIVSGDWQPGAAIPGEQDLAKTLGVGVGTVRKAMASLESRRLIERRRGRGSFVVDYSSSEVPTRFSCLRDGEATSGVIKVQVRSTATSRADLNECVSLNLSEGEDVVRINQVRTLDGKVYLTENISLPARLFPGLADGPIPTRISELCRRYHILPDHAVENVSVRAVTPAAATDLSLPEATPTLHIERIVFSQKDRPIEWRRAFCRLPKEISYSVRIG